MFGWTLQSLVLLASLQALGRDLDVVELFSGAGHITSAAQHRGFAAQGFDKARIPGSTDTGMALSEDIITRSGFMRAVHLVWRLRVGGLLWLAPLCSSWVFYNVSRTKRCKANGYMGDAAYAPVRDGNLMAEACIFLIKLAVSRGVQFAIENPRGSYIWLSHFLTGLQKDVTTCCINRCAFDPEPQGKRIQKIYQVWGSGAWVQQLKTACPCGNAQHLQLTETWVDGAGRKRVKGNSAMLKASQVYPMAMADLVLESWLATAAVPAPKAPPSGLMCNPRVPSDQVWLHPTIATQSTSHTTHTRHQSPRSPRVPKSKPHKPKASQPSSNSRPWAMPAVEQNWYPQDAPPQSQMMANVASGTMQLHKRQRLVSSASWLAPCAGAA